MKVCPTAAAAGARAAAFIADRLRAAIDERGHGSVALSGGRTPAIMLESLGSAPIDWRHVHVFQVDERIVDEDDTRRNMRAIRAAFEHSALPPDHMHDMPVGVTPPELAAARYFRELCAQAGTPPILDVVHLGLGADGHTASLVPGDAALDAQTDVALAGPYMGVMRMTLTFNALDRARSRVWLVTGRSKRDAVRRFLDRDPALVANRVRREASILILDQDAASERE